MKKKITRRRFLKRGAIAAAVAVPAIVQAKPLPYGLMELPKVKYAVMLYEQRITWWMPGDKDRRKTPVLGEPKTSTDLWGGGTGASNREIDRFDTKEEAEQFIGKLLSKQAGEYLIEKIYTTLEKP